MRKNFLIGNFLPAYGSTFGRIRRHRSDVPGLTPEQLEKGFRQRSEVRRSRRIQYLIVLQFGMVVALSVSVGVFRLEISTGGSSEYTVAEQEIVQMEEIVQTEQLEKPPPPPRPPIPVEVPNDIELTDDEMDFDSFLDLDAAITDLPPPAPVVDEDTEPEIFMIVENPPEMIGGFQALLAELKYPEIARRASIDGTVVVQIVVAVDGTPSNPKIVRSVQESLDNEALRAVMLQRFIPGKQRGRPVPVYMNIPVIFRLN
ncbi:MAG: energy transducer TonB [Rhodothermia bacterium]|nr:MAG: energy transducer TonB [Rhodothermia bacterium]